MSDGMPPIDGTGHPDGAGNYETAGDGQPQAAGSTATRPRLGRRPVRRPVKGRWAAALTALTVIVVMAVIASAFAAPSAAPEPAPNDGVVVPEANAFSSSAFCTAGTGTAADVTIYLTNSTDRVVASVMTTVGMAATAGAIPTRRRTIAVPANGSVAVNPAAGLPAGNNASTIVFSGGGVVASQVASGPGGWSTAPCATRTSAQWSFAGGSTTAGNSLELALFNPTSTEAVANVSFLTSAGSVTPQPYQGLVIPPGQVVAENVGDFVQNATAVASIVTAQSGMVVSDEFQQWGSGPTGGVSLQLGAPDPSTTWRFAQTTTVPTGTVDFTLANPGAATVTATFSVGLSSGTVVPRQLALAPKSTTVFDASTATGLPRQVAYSVVVTAPTPIVVGRTVQAPPTAASPPLWGGSAGTVTVADHWLVPAPGILHAPGTAGATVDSLAVANPGRGPARVTVTTPDGSRSTMTFTVAPASLAVLGPKQVGGISGLVVTSTSPVNVEEDCGPTGGPGIVSSAGFPFAP